MDISLQGYNSRYVTFLLKDPQTAQPGDLVAMSGDNQVDRATGGKFVGVLHSRRGEYGLVQTGGFARLGYTGSDPAVGFAHLAAAAGGGVTAGEDGREVIVTSVDPTAKLLGVLF